jgi:hypothetical protein
LDGEEKNDEVLFDESKLDHGEKEAAADIATVDGAKKNEQETFDEVFDESKLDDGETEATAVDGAKKNEQETKDGNDSAASDHSHSQTDDKDAGLDRLR